MSKRTPHTVSKKTSLLLFLGRHNVFLPIASFVFISLAVVLRMADYTWESNIVFIMGISAAALANFSLTRKDHGNE